MKPPAEPDDVQWHALTHAYGSAEDVPEPIRALYQGDEEAAGEAHHWITGSPDRAVPVLVEPVGPTPVGLRALKALAAIGQIPEELRPTLRSFFFSPLRLLHDSPFPGQGHPDEELRTLARTLLTAD